MILRHRAEEPMLPKSVPLKLWCASAEGLVKKQISGPTLRVPKSVGLEWDGEFAFLTSS